MLVKNRIFIRKPTCILTMVCILLAITFSGCTDITSVKGNGKMVDSELSITEPIKKIYIGEVPATLNVSAENSDKVTYSIDDNLKDLLNIEIAEGVLKISFKTTQKTLENANKILINVGSDMLEEISIDGVVTVNGSGIFTADTFTININGDSKANLVLNTKSTTLNVDGTARANISGKANDLSIIVGGTVEVNTRELIAQDVSIDLVGTGSIQVYADNRLDVSGNGYGTIKYWGNAKLTDSTEEAISIKKGIN